MKIHIASIFRNLESRIQPLWAQEETVKMRPDVGKNIISMGGKQELKLSPSFFEIDEEETLRVADHSKQCSNKKYHSEAKASENERDVLLYLIRHGEAEHNVLEKIAIQEALERSLQETGMGEESPETAKTMEDARKAVLNNENLRDAKLSDLGRFEAQKAHKTLSAICQKTSLEPPQRVLVSPLTRTLETASLVFPEHNCGCKIHVREDLSERKTGKPPDTRSSVGTLSLRKSFRRFSLNQLLFEDSLTVEQCTNNVMVPSTGTESTSAQDLEENREELRKRTHRLFHLLGETKHTSVAVVTHKGYLRELEKGPMKQGESVKEFQTCEIRVYRVTISNIDHRLVHAERVH